jgi:menaquinone-dependent protoporphyrinogen IX oxidase
MKCIILFDSKHGTTEEIAEMIRKGGGDIVNLNDLGGSGIDLSAYDRIAVGAPVYMGQWSKKAADFLAAHSSDLKGKRLSIFVLGSMKDKGEAAVRTALSPEVSALDPKIACFGGRVNPAKLGFFERLITKAIAKAPDSPGLDNLDLDAVEAFAASLHE